MRFHCIGVGSIGSLFAFHLRNANPAPETAISLIIKRRGFGRQLTAESSTVITVEDGGIRQSIGGFDVEVVDETAELLHDFLISPKGTIRLPVSSAAQKRIPRPTPLSKHLANTPGFNTSPIESLIVTTKTTSTLDAITKLQSRLSPSSTIVLLQNGMGVYDTLVSSLFKNPKTRPNFVLGTTDHGAWSKGPLDVVHAGHGSIHFSIIPDPLGRRDFEKSMRPYSNKAGWPSSQDILTPTENAFADDPPDKFVSLAETMRVLGQCSSLETHWVPIADMHRRLLHKLVINSCINPLTALLGCRNGHLFGNPPAHQIIRSVCAEAAAILSAHAQEERETARNGNRVPNPPTAKALETQVIRVARVTAANMSSMLQDVQRRRPTEIDFINGYMSRLGAKYGVPTPSNDMLLHLIKLKATVPSTRL